MREATLSTDVTVLHGQIHAMAEEITRLKEQLFLATRRQFGKSSEAFSIEQGLLFHTDDVALVEVNDEESGDSEPSPPPKKKTVRQAVMFSKDTPVVRQELDIPDADKTCGCCGSQLHRFGEDCTYQVEYIPAQTRVIETARPKYACRQCETGVKQQALPPSPIPKSMATASLLAFLIVSKYLDHQPLHRIQQMLARTGITLPRSTQCDWLMACARLLQRLTDRMKQDLVCSPQIFSDDTILPLQNDQKDRHRVIQARLWVYATQSKTGPPIVLYDFTRTRSKQGPHSFLSGYRGYLQADAYSGYDGLYKNGVKEVACLAHLRRYFFEASEQEQTPGPAHEALMMIQKLYRIERDIKHYSHKKRKKQRRLHAKPLLKKFRRWLEHQQVSRLPKGKLGKAIQYGLNHWDGFVRYCEAGYLEIDNNLSERAMKPVALGRKNYLFTGSERGGKAAATLYSLVESAKANQLNPYEYLKDVLQKLPSATDNDLTELLPYHWQAEA